MNIKKLMDNINCLSPNDFTLTQKLDWYNMCEAIVSSSSKNYLFFETVLEENEDMLILPDDINYDDIEYIYVNGNKIERIQFNKFGIWGTNNKLYFSNTERKVIKIAYNNSFKPIEYNILECSNATIDKDVISFSDENPFYESEKIELIIGGDNKGEFSISESYHENGVNYIRLENADLGYKTTFVTIQTSLLKECNAPIPFDGMYVYFILAKMCYFRHDYEGYNNAISVFNTLLDSYEKWSMSKNNTSNCISNIW